MLSTDDLNDLEALAVSAALEAGRYIQSVDRTDLKTETKGGVSSVSAQLVTEVDRYSERLIQQRLARGSERFDFGWVGEESSDDVSQPNHSRFQKPAFWCVDPLDGTYAFVNDLPGYAVSIALVDQAGHSLLGVVYDPVHDRLFQTHRLASQEFSHQSTHTHRSSIQRVHRQNMSLTEPLLEQLTNLQVDPSPYVSCYIDSAAWADAQRRPDWLISVEAHLKSLGYERMKLCCAGGAVLNACAVLTHENAFYLKRPKREKGGGALWDFAATAAMFERVARPVTNALGQPLKLNERGDGYMNQQGVLYSSDNGLHAQILLAFQDLENR